MNMEDMILRVHRQGIHHRYPEESHPGHQTGAWGRSRTRGHRPEEVLKMTFQQCDGRLNSQVHCLSLRRGLRRGLRRVQSHQTRSYQPQELG